MSNTRSKKTKGFSSTSLLLGSKPFGGDLLGIFSFLRRDTIFTTQSYQIPGSAISFKVLFVSRKIEKVFRHFLQKTHSSPTPQARRDKFLQSASWATWNAGPHQGSPGMGVGGGRTEEPARKGRSRGGWTASELLFL